MSEEHNDGTMSGLIKTLLGTVGTIVTAGGAYLGSQLFGGGEEKEATPVQTTAPAPVINITTNTNNTQQQKQAASGGTKVIERVVEKADAPKKKTEKEALQEEPKW